MRTSTAWRDFARRLARLSKDPSAEFVVDVSKASDLLEFDDRCNAMNAVLPRSYISHRRSASALRAGSSVVGQALEHHGSAGRAGSTDQVQRGGHLVARNLVQCAQNLFLADALQPVHRLSILDFHSYSLICLRCPSKYLVYPRTYRELGSQILHGAADLDGAPHRDHGPVTPRALTQRQRHSLNGAQVFQTNSCVRSNESLWPFLVGSNQERTSSSPLIYGFTAVWGWDRS